MISSYKKVDFTTITLMLMKNLALINLNVKTKKTNYVLWDSFFFLFFILKALIFFFFFFISALLLTLN